MIVKKEYERIASKWHGKIYQKYKKLKKRIPMIMKNIDFFRDAKVLELGCNAGMYALHMMPYIKGYIGIELDKHYYKQAMITLEGKKTRIFNKSFEDTPLEELDYDLFVASYVLHHLNEKEVEKLKVVFEKCNKVAIHTRSGDPLKYGHDEIGFDPSPKWENSRINYMLDELGYKSNFFTCSKKDYNGIYLILAEKS
ncbi:MAG: class I SAM-dependent methyltransferase [Desulfobacterales bacterium]